MIAIKDMEMPKSCENCDYFKGENTYCARGCFIPFNSPCDEKRPPNCPLVEIGTCKDCGLYRPDQYKNMRCQVLDFYPVPYFYCAHFEKRGNENESIN